jgi:hypothetical protein
MGYRKLFILGVVVATGFFFFRKTPDDGFSAKQISSSLPIHPEWAVPHLESDRQLKKIFSSPFKFLGEGAQAYAFESEDGKYVLKFFKMRRFTPSWDDYLCPHVVRRRLKNLRWVFNGYKMAYDHLREDTGLVYIHLTKTDYLNQRVVLIDHEGDATTIDLDQTEFVVQEKAELIFDRLSRLAQQGDQKVLQSAIQSVLALVQRRIDKGYVDRDTAVTNNYGFVGDRPIQIDIGRLYEGTKEKQLERIRNRIDQWRIENSKAETPVL